MTFCHKGARGNKKMSIPKILHYCWFGNKELDEKAKACIETWKKNCPDYEIKKWNESNFDINENQFCKEAYENKKWAFVSDYARIKILSLDGGIYLDTDMEILKNIDKFLDKDTFFGYESQDFIGTAIIGAKKDNLLIKEIVKYYEKSLFVNEDGTFNMTPNPVIITKLAVENFSLTIDGNYQELEKILTVYPKDYFYPIDSIDGKMTITENTYAIHHCVASWYSPMKKFKRLIKKVFIFIFGKKLFVKLTTKKSKNR